jgi:hypothetical protein
MSCAEGCRALSRLIEYLIGRNAALAVFLFASIMLRRMSPEVALFGSAVMYGLSPEMRTKAAVRRPL